MNIDLHNIELSVLLYEINLLINTHVFVMLQKRLIMIRPKIQHWTFLAILLHRRIQTTLGIVLSHSLS